MSSRPSPATVLAALALVVAVAVPSGAAFAHALTPASVKKLAKKTADKEIAKKAAGLSVGHASTASSADALGGVPASGYQPKGAITMSFSSAGWLNAQPDNVTFYRMPTQTQISTAANGLQLFAYPIAVPVQLADAPVTLTSVRYCYSANSDVKVSGERLEQVTFEDGSGDEVGSPTIHVLSLGNQGCRTIAANYVLGPHDQVSLEVDATWTATATFRLGAVTATFSPA